MATELTSSKSKNPFYSNDFNLDDISEDAFHDLFSQALEAEEIKEGAVVGGTIIGLENDYVIVDIGYKSEGRIPKYEFRDASGAIAVTPGDHIEVYLEAIEDEDGMLVLSKEKADLMKAWEDISKACENDEMVEGVITARVKGGLSVDIGVKAFLPGSQVDLRPVKNLDKLIGTRAKFKIIKFNKKRGNIVLSRRVLLEKEREERRKDTLKKIEVGKIMRGVVKNITDYGAFIDLGGIDGLLHITDMSYGRINHPGELFNQGDEVDVMILKFDPNTQRVSLGYKQIKPDPWMDADLKYPANTRIHGRVVSLTDYGAFVEIEEGIEGLVHISEMSWNKRIKHPSKLVSVNDEVDAVVLDIDVQAKRVSLGMKQLEANPWDVIEIKYPVSSVIEGRVRNITDFGIFVGVEEGIDGLVHISDISWGQRVKHPTDRFKKGQTVQAKVLNIDKVSERFSLGIKQLTADPWSNIQSRYQLGNVVAGTVVHVADFGLFVEIEEGVEGLIHNSELKNPRSGEAGPNYKEQDKIVARILSIDAHERRISLSEREADRVEAEEVRGGGAGGVSSSQATLGDIMSRELLSRSSNDRSDG
ncbi:MAG: 30S ribosomal protein S1 [Myxococcota bacterium]